MTLTISELASRAGVRPDTLRYYERLGLVWPAGRTPAGYRLYDDDATDRLRFIKGAQRFGLRLADIQELLEIKDRGQCPCGHTQQLLERRIDETDAELERLETLRRDLAELRERSRDCPPSVEGLWWCETEFARKGGDS